VLIAKPSGWFKAGRKEGKREGGKRKSVYLSAPSVPFGVSATDPLIYILKGRKKEERKKKEKNARVMHSSFT